MIMNYYQRKLPHLTPFGGVFFVTAVLKGCLPKVVMERLQAEKYTILEQLKSVQHQELIGSIYYEKLIQSHQRHFEQLDQQLDGSNYGKHYLKESGVAAILAKKIHQYDNELYKLEAFTIMSNHFHLLIDTSIQIEQLPEGIEPHFNNQKPLSKIMNLIKGGSSFLINKHLRRTGALWQQESYDRLVRDETEQANIHQYILNNPVKAGIVQHWKDYPYSYSIHE